MSPHLSMKSYPLKAFLIVFALAGALTFSLYQGHNPKTVFAHPQSHHGEKATLICKLDEKGALWSSCDQTAQNEWQRVWPDQMSTVIRDEKDLHKEKALVSIEVHPQCPFIKVWQFLEACAQENLSASLRGPSLL